MPLDDEVVNAGERTKVGGHGIPELGADLGAREVTEVGQGAGLDDLAGLDDAHVIAEGLDLAEDVTRQEHRLALAVTGTDDLGELPLHEGVQA